VQSNFVTPSALHKILQLESSSKPTDNQISIAIDFQN